jgi:hypothetical protein
MKGCGVSGRKPAASFRESSQKVTLWLSIKHSLRQFLPEYDTAHLELIEEFISQG